MLTTQIQIRNLEFQGRHGASADERKTARRFQVDVDMTARENRATVTDRLSDTVNYHEVCGLIHEIGAGKPYRLLEALAATMIEQIGKRWPDIGVTLELRKLHPACPGNPAYTAVRLSR